jgi:acetyl esterase
VTDCASESGSYERFATGHFLTRDTMRYFRATFVPDAARRAEPDASPLRAPAQKTAPAYVLLAECDVLHDEGVAYAEKLRAEGTDVTLDDVPGVLHGFLSMQGLAVSRDAMTRAGAWVGTVLES